MFTIRPFDGTDSDYEQMIVIDTAVFTGYPMSVEEWQHIDATREAKHLFHRDMIERDGQVVAFGDYGHLPWGYHPRKFNMSIIVHPDHEDPAILPIYFEHVQAALAEYDPLAITTHMFEDRAFYVSFLHEMGFREVMRNNMSVLDVLAFDAARFAHVQEKMRAANIQILPVAALQETDPDWQPKLYRLFSTVVQDVPTTDAREDMSFEQFQERMLTGPMYAPDCWFVAVDEQGQYIGTCEGSVNPVNGDQFNNRLTGVLRSHRRRGIATALKLHLIDAARRKGAKVITTGNEANNPMYTLNLKLGFKPEPAWVKYEKTLQPEPDRLHPTP